MSVLVPRPALRPFIGKLWASTSTDHAPGTREHVLPTGQMHMVFRLAGPALRVYASAQDTQGDSIGVPVLGGARTSFYVKELGPPVVSVGVQLLPGAAQALFGVSAGELAERHTSLHDVWGSTADAVLEQLTSEPDPQRRLARLESMLARHFAAKAALHPCVAQALSTCADPGRIGDMVRESHYSHRGFIALFRQATGMSPKRYARMLRFQALLERLRADASASLSELALASGFSDQAHMTRECRELAGVTPSQYRLLAPAAAHHVMVSGAQVNFIQDAQHRQR